MSRALTSREAVKYLRENCGLHCSQKSLVNLTRGGLGPDYFKDGHQIRYFDEALDAWAWQFYTSTSLPRDTTVDINSILQKFRTLN